ncbi:MAG TPA: penicillin-binding protein 1C [Gemmatimonadales bacterium]|nr:penicillin-binding protein 1C [Gemmatimonadales bacterium]
MTTTRATIVRRLRRAGLTGLCATATFWLLPRVIPHQPLRARFVTSTAVYDADGGLLRLTRSADDRYRVWVTLDRISPLLVDATLLQEDRHFRRHPGVNPVALVRGAWRTYVVRQRREGGSTITMQLARLLYHIRSSTPGGKLVQIARAVQLELCYTKREILEAYLNIVPYGGNVEGAAAASLVYFGKDPSRLTLSEALTLAVLPQSPTRRAPTAGRQDAALREARNALYARWQATHPRVEGEADLMQLAVHMGSPAALPFRAPHLVDAVLAGDGAPPEIHTTLDRQLQAVLEREIRAYVTAQARIGVHNAAAMLVDVRTMAVKALVGSADFFDAGIAGQVNGTAAKRSPGSTLKPFIYALGLDQGVLHPMTVLKDAPSAFGAYSPENFDGRFVGPLTARDALIRSRNVPAVYVASQLSKPDLYDFLEVAGVSGLRSREYYGLALVLGGGEVTMEELVSLYGALANQGLVRPVHYRADQTPEAGVQVLSPEASYVTLDMLKDNPRPDAPSAARQGRLSVYWKTGTSYGFRDAWTIGIFGPYILAVWIGNFDGEGNPAFVGVQVAAPLFFRMVDAIEAQQPSLGEPVWRFPANLTLVDVCAGSGDLPNADCPRTVPTWFIPGKSPIRISTLDQALLIDDRTGLRDCPPYTPGPAHRVVYEMWGSDMLRLFQQAGLPRRTPPPFDPRCESHSTGLPGSSPPQITSPLRGVVYSLRAWRIGQETFTLRATSGAGVRAAYWFIGKTFLGQVPPGGSLAWKPQAPGSFVVRVVDDQGQADARLVQLAVVP